MPYGHAWSRRDVAAGCDLWPVRVCSSSFGMPPPERCDRDALSVKADVDEPRRVFRSALDHKITQRVASLVKPLGPSSARRPEQNEWAAPNELPHRRLRAQIAPAENRREEARPPRMAAPKLEPPQRRSHLRRGIAARERTISRPIWICSAGCGPEVAHPFGVRAPGREDDGFAGVRRRTSAPSRPSRVACRSSDPGGRSAGRCGRAAGPSRGGRAGAAGA